MVHVGVTTVAELPFLPERPENHTFVGSGRLRRSNPHPASERACFVADLPADLAAVWPRVLEQLLSEGQGVEPKDQRWLRECQPLIRLAITVTGPVPETPTPAAPAPEQQPSGPSIPAQGGPGYDGYDGYENRELPSARPAYPDYPQAPQTQGPRPQYEQPYDQQQSPQGQQHGHGQHYEQPGGGWQQPP